MAKHKLVLAEDDPILSKVLVEELGEVGFQVHHAKNGKEAVKLIQSKKPDLLLCDVLMPEKSGFEVLEEIKKSPATSGIPVIMLTMLGSDDDIKKGLKLGANDYIVKSQHAVGEIVEKVQEFFSGESKPEAAKSESTSQSTNPTAVPAPSAPESKVESKEKKEEEVKSAAKTTDGIGGNVVDLRQKK